MASSLRFINLIRSPSLPRACHRCECNLHNRVASVVVKRSLFCVARHPRWPSESAEDDGPRIGRTGPVPRPFHSSRCVNRINNDDGALDADEPIGRVDDDGGGGGGGGVVVRSTSSDDGDDGVHRTGGGSFADVPGATNTKGKKLAIVYTCKVCGTRSAKQITDHAYRHGVVLVRCPGCQNLHLIADRLGWFEERGGDGRGWDVEKLVEEAGENVKAVSGDDILELTLKDIVGTKT
jgi:protein import protein ZIM17